jgi:Transposase domain (DUF772)
MNFSLATPGTAELLEQLSPFIPDDFINEWWPARRGRGRRTGFRPVQLYRVLLLSLLTPAHSFNLLIQLLKEQRAWRHFAPLPNRHPLPTASLLHDFRERVGVGGLRRIRQQWVGPLWESRWIGGQSVALIDSTDLPAAPSAYKKS